jgi:hypothetical protein
VIVMMPAHLGTKAIVALISALLAMSEATAQEATSETTETLSRETPTPITENATGTTGSGMILVSKRPIEVLAGPSSSASLLYGFPAGRPFRLIGRKAGFAQIQDLKSGATGWIDDTALTESPPVTEAAASSDSRGVSPNQNGPASAELNTQNSESHGIFGLGSNGRQGVLSGFLGGMFGTH